MLEVDRQIAALEEFVRSRRHRQRIYGWHWGEPESETLASVVDEWLTPAARRAEVVVEVGVGGGRWVPYYARHVKRAYLVDGTPAAREAVLSHISGPFEFLVSPDGRLPAIADAAIDYVWSFDTFVHFHRELFDAYVREIGRILRPGGILHLHYAVKWPELEGNAECFLYREPAEIEQLLWDCGLVQSPRRRELRHGFGSLLVESIKR